MPSIEQESSSGDNIPDLNPVREQHDELLQTIESTLKSTQERFIAMQDKILARLDTMTEQLKDLERRVDSVMDVTSKGNLDEFDA